jgi:hypothetical protein
MAKILSDILAKEYCKVELDLTAGSAYQYRADRVRPTTIKYGRNYDGKWETGSICQEMTNDQMHDVIFMIKRGQSKSEIHDYIKTVIA